MGGTLTLSRSKTVRFLTPIQPTDLISVEFSPNGTVWMEAGKTLLNGSATSSNWNDEGGNQWGHYITAVNSTDVSITFGQFQFKVIGGATTNWSSSNAYWRVKKSRAGIPVGFGIASATDYGLVKGGAVPGSTSGAAISAGMVGERITSTGSASAYISGTWNDGGSSGIALTAGVWSVSATCGYVQGTDTTLTAIMCTIGTSPGTSSAGSSAEAFSQLEWASHTPTGQVYLNSGSRVINIAGTTTYYPKALVVATRGTGTILCNIYATRIA
jgi:hypothetical protein